MPSNALQYMLDRFNSLEKELNEYGNVVMNDDDTINEITELNKQQLHEGKRSDGSNIEPPYRPFTIREKRKKGQPTDRVTLEDTGDFYAQLRVKSSHGKSEVYDTNWKSDMLEAKYNDGDAVIFGLAPKYIELLRAFLLPDFLSFSQNYFRS